MNAKKDGHGETCKCRRCRAREESLERRPIKLNVTELPKNFYSGDFQYQSDDDD